MKKNYGYAYLVLLLCVNIFIILFENNLLDKAKFSWVNDELNESEGFRQTKINSNTLEYMLQNSLKGSELSKFVTKVWFHEKITGKEFSQNYIKEFENAYWFHPLLKDFKTEYEVLEQSNQALWGDLKYFPVAFSTGNEKMTVTYENSWK